MNPAQTPISADNGGALAPEFTPDISIIIPSWNCAHILPQTLAALAAQHSQRAREVIVVDDCSSDATEQAALDSAARYPHLHLRFIRKPQRSNAGASRNTGLHHAKAHLVWFLDADIVTVPQALETHWAFHCQHPEEQAIILGNVQIPPDWPRTPYIEISNAAREWDSIAPGAQLPWTYFFAGNISVKKGFLLSVGGFNEKLHRSEDVEIGRRLYDLGLKIFYARDAVGYHYHLRTPVQEFANNWSYGEMFAHHYHSGDPILQEYAKNSWFMDKSSPIRFMIKKFLGGMLANAWTFPLTWRVTQRIEPVLPQLAGGIWRLCWFYAGMTAFTHESRKLQQRSESDGNGR